MLCQLDPAERRETASDGLSQIGLVGLLGTESVPQNGAHLGFNRAAMTSGPYPEAAPQRRFDVSDC